FTESPWTDPLVEQWMHQTHPKMKHVPIPVDTIETESNATIEPDAHRNYTAEYMLLPR
ncbi:3442_t:CDS:1, partial [Gigaspora rosea]